MQYKEFFSDLFEAYPYGTYPYETSDAEQTSLPKEPQKRSIQVSDLVEDAPCWDGYVQYGMKEKNGKQVPNCVPANEVQSEDEIEEFCPLCMKEVLQGQHADQLGEAEYQGRKVSLGKPMRGDVKKFKVFVKDPSTGNVKKVNFGDKTMRIKKSNPKRRKSFRARHNCANPGPRTKARYWSCRKW